MTAFRSAQRAYDAQTPPEPDHDWTEDMPRSEFREYLMVWFDCATRAEQEAVTEFINARKAREFLENLP